MAVWHGYRARAAYPCNRAREEAAEEARPGPHRRYYPTTEVVIFSLSEICLEP